METLEERLQKAYDNPKYICMDCHVSTQVLNEYYMLHQKLWLKIHPEDDGMLCIGCAETRLGRQLNSGDFTHYPVNCLINSRSERLIDRLTTFVDTGHG